MRKGVYLRLSTLAIKKVKKSLRKKADIWLYLALFFCLVGRVYEYFAYNVFSYALIYAFVYALVFGCLFRIILIKSPVQYMPGHLSNSMYDCGIITLTVGAIIDGILEIYGTVSTYIRYYYIVGTLVMLLALILFIIGIQGAREEQ